MHNLPREAASPLAILGNNLIGVQSVHHRRRINTEEKAKVVASVWGKEFIPFLAPLGTYFAQDDFEE